MIKYVNKRLYGERNRSPISVALNVILVFLVLILAAEITFGMFFTGIYVTGDSMLPTLTGADLSGHGGEYIYVYKYAEPKRGDIVVVYDKKKHRNIIKRVLALGGDTVWFEDGVFYLNGEPVQEDYVSPDNNTKEKNANGYYNLYYNTPYHEVKSGCMYLVGDNRNQSDDSRNEINGDYPMQYLVGVMPQWSQNIKGFSTYWYTFFNFTLRGK